MKITSFSSVPRPALVLTMLCGGFLLLDRAPAAFPPGVPDIYFALRGLAYLDSGSMEGAQVAVRSDGRIIAAGNSFSNSPRGGGIALARYLPDGTMDAGFGESGRSFTPFPPDSNEFVRGVAFQSDGRILVASNTTSFGDIPGDHFTLIRYLPDGGLDPSFGEGGRVTFGSESEATESLTEMAVQSDGKILMTGRSPGGLLLVRHNADGTLDQTFGGGDGSISPVEGFYPGVSGPPGGVAVRNDGKIFVSGYHSSSGGSMNAALVRLNADGSLDTSFGDGGRVGVSSGVRSTGGMMALQKDGKILMTVRPVFEGKLRLLRLNADGGVDDSFKTVEFTPEGAGYHPADIAVRPDGGIILAGTRSDEFTAMALLADGTPDRPFGNDGIVTVAAEEGAAEGAGSVVLQSDGKIILAGGTFDSLLQDSDFALVRLEANGTPDTAFGRNGKVITSFASRSDFDAAPAPLADGGVLLAFSSLTDEEPDLALTRFNSKGELDLSFGEGTGRVKAADGVAAGTGGAVTALAEGKILATGSSRGPGGGNFVVVRRLADGSPDPVFGEEGRVDIDFGGDDRANSLAPLSGGGVVLAGTTTAGDGGGFAVVKLHADGSLDGSFGEEGKVTIRFTGALGGSVAVWPDGKIVVAGTVAGGAGADAALFRLHADGSLDETFGDGGRVITSFGDGDDFAARVVLQNDGKIVVAGGARSETNTEMDTALARWHPDGAPDNTFGTGGIVITGLGTGNDAALDAAVQPDGKIVTAGCAGGSALSKTAAVVARFTASGTLDAEFGSGGKAAPMTTGGARAEGATGVAVQPDGKIVAAGFAAGQTGGKRLTLLRLTGSLTLNRQESWRRLHFGFPENAGAAADNADYDGDGITNLVEWACGLDPKTANPSPLDITADGAGGIHLLYNRGVSAAEAGAGYEVEQSTDLPGGWMKNPSRTEVISGDELVERLKASVYPPTLKRLFFRLRVTPPGKSEWEL